MGHNSLDQNRYSKMSYDHTLSTPSSIPEAPKFPNQIPSSQNKSNTFPPPKKAPVPAKPEPVPQPKGRYTRSKTQIISSEAVKEALKFKTEETEEGPRLTVSQLKQNLLQSSVKKETVKTSETISTSTKSVASRLNSDQINVLNKSLTQPKKPKNKYRRADTTPGLFQDMTSQMDSLFDDFNDSMINKDRANDDNMIRESVVSHESNRSEKTPSKTDKVEEIKKSRPRAPSARRPPTRWTAK
jgi:hypothetical protein